MTFQSCDSLYFDNCEILRNKNSDGAGGALAIAGASELTFGNSTIALNYAKEDTGGIYIYGSGMEVRLFNSILSSNFIENSAEVNIYSGVSFSDFYGFNSCIPDKYTNVSPQLLNCITSDPQFRDVSEDSLSGTIEFIRLSNVVNGTNSHFVDELQVGDNIYLEADGSERALCVKEIISDTKLILSAVYKGDAMVPGNAKVEKNHLDLQRINDGDANDSPCIDNGNNNYVNSILDLLGFNRIVDGDSDSDAVVDMGAREKQ